MYENQESDNQEPESEVLDFNNPEYTFIPGRHVYRQQGPYLVCKNCELHHAVYVGMEKIMVGEEEDGTPILRERSELNE